MLAWLNLSLCIATTSVLFIGLRAIGNYKIDLTTFVGINYLSAAATGLISFPNAIPHVFANAELAFFACLQGASFFGLFIIMGILSQKIGLGFMTILSKMSLVIPVLFSWLYYGDDFTVWHAGGITLALAAVVFVNFGESSPKLISDRKTKIQLALLSVILFLGHGASDSLFKHIQQTNLQQVDSQEYIIVLFAMAGLVSIPIVVYRLMKGQSRLNLQTIGAGIAIGVPNYFSIVFLAASLKYFDGTVFYPINNTVILFLMTLIGILAFKESLNWWKAAGLIMALVAVLMLV